MKRVLVVSLPVGDSLMKTRRLDNLIDLVLDEVATPAERQEFEHLLSQSPEARSQFLQACGLRTTLADLYDAGFRQAERPLAAPSSAGRGRRVFRSILGVVLALAACLLLAAGVRIFSQPPIAQRSGGVSDLTPSGLTPSGLTPSGLAPSGLAPSSASAATHQPPAVARIVRKIDCVWNDEAWSLGSSSEIDAGQTVSIERGFMSLELVNGVRVLLDGPADFTIVDELHGVLEFGGIGVRVPDGFSGYIVETPTAKVTDLGTEFSVVVNQAGDTDLRVIEGEVTVSERKKNGQVVAGEPKLLAKNATWNSAGLRAPKGAPSVKDFPRVSLLEDPEFQDPTPLPVAGNLLLWLRADRAVKQDSKERIIAWGDLSTQEHEDRHSAWQVQKRRRPRRVADGIGGHPSIRFDGDDDCLVTEPFNTSDQQTVVVVGRINSLWNKKSHGMPSQQLLNYNGPPHLVLEYRSPAKQLRARAYAGPNSEREHAGWTNARAIGEGEALGLVYSYDHLRNEASLYLNGELQEASNAAVPIANKRPKVIGLHRGLWGGGLAGDIAEIIIFDRAISQQEAAQLNEYLIDRYGLSGVGG